MAKHKEKPKLEYNLPHKNRKHKNASVTRRAYTYDGRGNLTGEEESGELLHGYEYGAINRLTRAHNSRGEGRDGLQELHYYLQDELGSPLRVSTTEGYLTYGYDEFGNDLGEELEKAGIPSSYTRQGEGQPFGYTGYRYDDISGTYFAQAREYQPESGRFVEKDADYFIKFDKIVSLNQYIYCNENPINYIDWSGNDSYVFYDPLEFEKQAMDEKERLEKCYGDTVNLIPIDSNEELKEIWNQEVVEEKSIDEISLLFHGQPHALIINEATNSVFTTNESGKTNRGTKAIYIGELEVSMMIGGRDAEILYSILTEGYKEECCGN